LAQLHQLRGRVGRSSRRAYAYLTFTPGRELTEIARSRLGAIREFTEFGSGFKIALRDLELRGAGNLLGGEQHGHMDSVGYDMYIRLLADAVGEQKGEPTANDAECTVDIQIPAHIPEGYISDLQSRLGIYRRIADIRSDEDALDVTDELIDRFGEPPAPVSGLIQVALARNKAAAAGITDIEQAGDTLRLYPKSLDMAVASAIAERVGDGFSVVPNDARPHYALRLKRGEQPLAALIKAFG
jgi:transcription-repair coupling factor (superfamily II helicase)